MLSRDTWSEIFQTLHKNKLRTFLSGFTVALGIFIVVVLVGLSNGLQNTFDELFSDNTNNAFFILPGRTTLPYKGYKSGRSIEFDNSDLADIPKNFPAIVEYITPRMSRSSLVKYKNEANNYTNRAVSPMYQFNEKTIMMKGRYLNQADIQNRSKHVVIGRLVEQDLFKGENALGKYVDLGGSAFKVVGVFQDEGGDNEERILYLPYTTRQLLEKSNDKVERMVVSFQPEIGYAGAMAFEKSLTEFLKQKKYISPKDESGFFIRNRADQYHENQQFALVLAIISSIIALGTLIAGIIGISNIMVFVVKERTKEIGIRKALGATPKTIVSTILLEAITITTLSGFAGMLLGVALLGSLGETLENFFIKNPYIDPAFALAATLVLIVFGAIAGYIPARRAARIKPIVALRDE